MGTSIFMVAGFMISAVVFSGQNVDTIGNLNTLILQCNIALTLIFIFFNFSFQAEPELPPTKVATEEIPKRHLKESFSELFRNRNMLLICIVYSIAIAPYNAFGSITSLLFTPYGISISQISVIGSSSVFVGVITSVFFGAWLDRTRAYKKSMLAATLLPIITCVGFKEFLPGGPD